MSRPQIFNWNFILRTNISLLRVTGLWSENEEGYKLGTYLIQTAVLLTCFLFGHIFFQAINIAFIYNDLEAVTQIIYILMTKILLLIKVYYWIKNRKLLKILMGMISDDLFQPRNYEQISLIEPSVNFWRAVYKALLLIVIGANTFWALFPILDKSPEKRLPFLAWYPYNWRKSPLYEMTFLYQMMSCGYISCIHMNIDTTIAALNMFCGNQLDILCDNFRNLRTVDTDLSVEKNLIECISHHKLIVSFAEISNKFFNWILFLQFFVSGISLGLTMFQLTLVVPFSNQFYFLLSYINAVIVQIFMFCWFGNEVQVKSEEIPYSIFESDWVAVSLEMKKSMLFLILRTQRSIKVTAINLFNLSLETFVKILKTGWSYFALLNQVNS